MTPYKNKLEIDTYNFSLLVGLKKQMVREIHDSIYSGQAHMERSLGNIDLAVCHEIIYPTPQ
jgi:hypothetical protein